MKKLVFWDLEGPLSPMDHAYETAKEFEITLGKNTVSGQVLFKAMSDAIAWDIENNPETIFQAGDTLSFLVPFLVDHGIRDEKLKAISENAQLVAGVKETITTLRNLGAQEHILSTSYDGTSYVASTSFIHHADRVGQAAGIDEENIHATPLNLNSMSMNPRSRQQVKLAEQVIIDLQDDPKALSQYLKDFAKALEYTGFGNPLRVTPVMGGKRKAKKIKDIVGEDDYSQVVVIGDSITDRDMLQLVKDRGGLAIAFNANIHALSHANVSIATSDMRDVLPLIQSFWDGGLEGARKFVETDGLSTSMLIRPRKEGFSMIEKEKTYAVHWLEEVRDFSPILKVNMDKRALVRGEAAKLA